MIHYPYSQSVTALTFSQSGMISASEDCTICLWDVNSWTIIRRFNHQKGNTISSPYMIFNGSFFRRGVAGFFLLPCEISCIFYNVHQLLVRCLWSCQQEKQNFPCPAYSYEPCINLYASAYETAHFKIQIHVDMHHIIT